MGHPHIKTNLYGLDRHIETIREFNVSISGSWIYLFPCMKNTGVTKGGEGTLERILDNIRLLEEIPDKKKVSATNLSGAFRTAGSDHQDIRFLDRDTCLDMNDLIS